MSAHRAWPFLPSSYREVDWKLLLPLLHHFSFLSSSRQLRGRKNHYLDQGQWLDGASESLASPDQNVFPGISESASSPSSPFSFPALIAKGLAGCSRPSESPSSLSALLLTEAFRKRVVEISEIQQTYIFNCLAPFWHKCIIFPFSDSFGHEHFCKCV